MKEVEVIKNSEFISCKLESENIQVFIKYPKRSTLKDRFALLEKLKEVLLHI